jgi:uncharacterized protein HemY
MLNAIIFACHYIFALIIFTKKWQDDKLGTAFINLMLIGVLFAVGWTLATTISMQIPKELVETEKYRNYFDRDTIALVLLSTAEYFFYKMYYSEVFSTGAETEKQ